MTAPRRVILAVVTALLVGAPAHAESPEALAQKAAESWLKLVDAGQYAESWDAAAPVFKGAVTKEQWKQAAGAARTPLGALVSRTLKSRQLTHTLPGAPDGFYVVIQYDAVFKNKAAAVETVTAVRADGTIWKVVGYFVR